MTVAEIQPYQDHGGTLPAVVPDQGYAELASWAMSAQAAYSVAEKLVQTSFVPVAFRGKPHEATAAILSGAEVGLSPMASMRAFDIIQGSAAARALTLRAIVQSKGHDIWSGVKSSTRVVMYGRRKGSAQTEEVEWTIQRARDLGLTGKPNWKSQPQTMLIARATSEVCRLIAADAILGMPYSVEELSDGADREPDVEDRPAPVRATAQRTRARAVAAAPPVPPTTAAEPAQEDAGSQDGPALPGEPGYEDAPLSDAVQGEDTHGEPQANPAQPLTAKQRSMIMALFNSHGISDRAERLDISRRIVGRAELATANDLTLDEASALIDKLQQAEEHEDGFSGYLAELLTATEPGGTA